MPLWTGNGVQVLAVDRTCLEQVINNLATEVHALSQRMGNQEKKSQFAKGRQFSNAGSNQRSQSTARSGPQGGAQWGGTGEAETPKN